MEIEMKNILKEKIESAVNLVFFKQAMGHKLTQAEFVETILRELGSMDLVDLLKAARGRLQAEVIANNECGKPDPNYRALGAVDTLLSLWG
jgi:hypothetical protein